MRYTGGECHVVLWLVYFSVGEFPTPLFRSLLWFDTHKAVKLINGRKLANQLDQAWVVIQGWIGVSTADAEGIGVGKDGSLKIDKQKKRMRNTDPSSNNSQFFKKRQLTLAHSGWSAGISSFSGMPLIKVTSGPFSVTFKKVGSLK